ncbi:MAG TPA: proton-conducting transporter membrane subunit, partial [Wenzhouxiangella sp.]
MTDWSLLLPFMIFIGGAGLIALLPQRVSWVISTLTPLVSGWFAWQLLAPGLRLELSFMDYTLNPVSVDALGLLMVGLFHVAAFIGALFISPIKDRLQHGALLTYLAGGIGVVMAGDWLSFFVFFEVIALSGAALVLARRDEVATQAGVRYLLFQIAAGVTVLAGILLHANQTGDWSVGPVALNGLAGWLLLVGFGIKTGFPLVHIWLVDAYPKASVAGLAVLVAVTTKVGVLALMRTFPGESVLVPIGVVMALWPIAYVLTENNLRRVLAYSMMVQLGLMVVAIGVGTPTALDGVALHIVMDVLFKMTLFMALALIFVHLQTTDADRLGGLAKHWPVIAGCVVVAVLANIAVPLTGAFISKKLMLSAIETSDLPHILYWVLVSLSVVGLLYGWVRIAWRVFFAANENAKPTHIPPVPGVQQLALLIPVVLLLLTGFWPGLLDGLKPFDSATEVFTLKKILAQLAMLGGAGGMYLVLSRFGLGL